MGYKAGLHSAVHVVSDQVGGSTSRIVGSALSFFALTSQYQVMKGAARCYVCRSSEVMAEAIYAEDAEQQKAT